MQSCASRYPEAPTPAVRHSRGMLVRLRRGCGAIRALLLKVSRLLFFWLSGPKLSEAERLKEKYDQSRGMPFVSVKQGTTESLLIVDPSVIKEICISGFNNFHDRGLPRNEKTNPLSAHLFSLSGKSWKKMRSIMTPAFTPAKVKAMLPEMAQCGAALKRALHREATGRELGVDITGLLERYAVDVTAQCCFWFRSQSLEDAGDVFYQHCRAAFEPSPWRDLRELLIKWVPRLAVLLPYRTESATFFRKVMSEMERIRKEEGQELSTKNFLGVMLNAKRRSAMDGEDAFNFDRVMMAQTFATFRAGFEATAPVLAFCLLELAHNPNIQHRVREEVDRHAEISYEAVQDMKYMDAVIAETLRKYPPNAVLARICTEAHQIAVPGGKTAVRKGQKILIPVYGLHNDERAHQQPEDFDPERFYSVEGELRCPRGSGDSGHYIPFGLGPRSCPARGFGLVQIKVGLAAILSEFEVQPCRDTRLPVEFLPGRRLVLVAAKGCQLRVVPRQSSCKV